MSDPARRTFACTRGGAIARGRRRLATLLGGLGGLMVLVALAAWISGRIFPGFLAMGVALLILMAWRMGTDLVPREIWLEGATLTLLTPGQLIRISIEGATARPLDSEEIEHIERLATAGGIITGTGGFDSHKLREFDLHATNLDNAILVQGPEGRMVLTPDEPDAFIETLTH